MSNPNLLRHWPVLLLLTGAASAAPLPVTTTNSIIADFVRNIGGTRVSVSTIVPAGADTHSFQPTTAAIRALASSKVLFANGAGLEPWLPKLKAASKTPVTDLTAGLKLRAAPDEEEEHAHETHDQESHEHDEHDHGPADPHAWWDVRYAAQYARKIAATLSALDPAGKATYQKNLTSYTNQLMAVDAAARKQFATLPAGKRKIVTNHDALHYFAARYHLNIVGTVLPGLSTEREPSARELAELVQNVKKSGARAIFTENTVNTRLAQTLARETGVKVAPPLFTDALAPAGQPGSTFLQALRLNVDTVVKALK
ncbi:metal ABC transporter solute-binding protein, Zn/Mn family [Deinococcus fonticola]|uniref:metal ABC transporter solute-binding protein, Zn/Mn family n=1 Tax=Deinococcus fonticola TaxID=2528713 RepID=UPI00107540B7|nr:zinc ABC transporter substrate-binding protein [Deinococcus fonticola]